MIALLFNRNAFEKCGERAGFRVLQVSRESVFCLLGVSFKWRFWRLPVARRDWKRVLGRTNSLCRNTVKEKSFYRDEKHSGK